MQELGRLEDLPADYRKALTAQNLVPLWPSLRAVLPAGKPALRTRPTFWAYERLRPLLLKAGELTPIEKAERRVLVLANPGHGLEKMQASSSIYLGMQLLLPGEWAPATQAHAQRSAHDRGRQRRIHHGRWRKVPDEPWRPDPDANRPLARTWT